MAIAERIDHRLERKARYERQLKKDRDERRRIQGDIDEIVRGARESLKWDD